MSETPPFNPNYQDGDYDTPIRISRTPYRYPFRQNGDVTTREYDATYVVNILKFSPTAGGTVDPENAGHYLLFESEPEIFQGKLATFVRTYSKIPTTQTVPGSRNVTLPELTGDFPQEFSTGIILKPDATVGRYEFYTRKTVTSDSGALSLAYPSGGTYPVTVGPNTTAGVAYNAPAATLETALDGLTLLAGRGGCAVSGSYNTSAGFTVTYADYAQGALGTGSLTGNFGTGFSKTNNGRVQSFYIRGLAPYPDPPPAGSITAGTYTVTLFGQTTGAVAYNADIATLQAAINALSFVNGQATVTVPSGFTNPLKADGSAIEFTITIALPAVSVSTASLTPAGSNAIVAAATHGFTLRFTGVAVETRTFYAAAHDISASNNLYLKQGADYVTLATGLFTVPDANTVVITATAGSIFTDADLVTEIGKKTTVSYTAGVRECRVKFVSDFYLPGVSPGIATADDIPLPAYEGDAASILNGILSGDTSININTGELGQYRDSAMLFRTITTLNPQQL
jgi:hypothetical protein